MGPKKILKTKSEWLERVVAIERVTKVVKEEKMSFRAIIVVGNEQGKVGVGVGKAGDVIAVRKGVITCKAYHNCSFNKFQFNTTCYSGRFGCQANLRPSAPGSGVIAGSSIRTVLELAGIKNILSKQLGSNNLLNNARATINGLSTLRSYNFKIDELTNGSVKTTKLLQTKILKIFSYLILIRLGLYIPVPNVDLDLFQNQK